MSDRAEGEGADAIDSADQAPFFVVGLGASAGGLEALVTFLEAMPSDSGLAFVVITHQHPDQPSLLPELLGRRTAMTVELVEQHTRACANRVYLPRPGHELAIIDGVLQVMESVPGTRLSLPIDYFFRSLARDQGERAVGIVLSGTGTDGTLGLREIKAALGMVMVQDEQSAEHAGMPHSAIATELVDYVLPAADLPAQLMAYVAAADGGPQIESASTDWIREVLVLVRDRTGHDFSGYKGSTVARRISRRMSLRQVDDPRAYLRLMQTQPEESEQLFKDLLIGVTAFFRDHEAWEALADALATLLPDRPEGHVFRAWTAGCATGEEAYSLAILLDEIASERGEALGRPDSVQIFATDLDSDAIAHARSGDFPVGIANDLSPERLARFFVRGDDGYRVKKRIREMVVFAPQNVIADPPFTKLDLIVCRNLLIYLDESLQRRLLPVFHYALQPGGILFLGASESLGAHAELFAPLNKHWKVYRRIETLSGSYPTELPASAPPVRSAVSRAAPTATSRVVHDRFGGPADRMLLEELTPPTVLVRERGDVVYVHGRTGTFLEPAQGAQSTTNIFNMARDGLQLAISTAIRHAATADDEIVLRDLCVRTNGDRVLVDLRARRCVGPEALRGLIRISFERVRAVPPTVAPPDDEESEATEATDLTPEQQDEITSLQRELLDSRHRYQLTFEELESANAELKSMNEELQSSNEELQSANEELATSKEEMQSLNEELHTVNTELQSKVGELSDANNDMKNLLNGIDIGTVFLDTELRIVRYTEQVRRVVRIRPQDLGRPIGDLTSTLRYDALIDDAREVFRTLTTKEKEVQAEDGATYLLRILPYRTMDNVVSGLVLTFIDLTDFRRLEREQARLMGMLEDSAIAVVVQDAGLVVRWVSGTVFGRSADELVGKTDEDLVGEVEGRRLAAAKQRVLDEGVPDRERVELGSGGERQVYELLLAPLRAADPTGPGVTTIVVAWPPA